MIVWTVVPRTPWALVGVLERSRRILPSFPTQTSCVTLPSRTPVARSTAASCFRYAGTARAARRRSTTAR